MDISFNKCGIAIVSSGNINREIQLIIDVIDYKMFKESPYILVYILYLVSMLSAHEVISQCDYKFFCARIST